MQAGDGGQCGLPRGCLGAGHVHRRAPVTSIREELPPGNAWFSDRPARILSYDCLTRR